ncbi:hypothetical protein ACHAXH_007092 [Discostella pseudostelligera]
MAMHNHRRHQHYAHQLRMTPGYGTEGFRDAIRGSQEYIKHRGDGSGGAGGRRGVRRGGGNEKKLPESSSAQSITDPQQHQQKKQQQQQQQQQPQKQPPQSIPFPKLTPGRRRNYRPPHVIQQLKQSSQLVMNSYEDEDDDEVYEENKNLKDYCDEEEDVNGHCLENFRDGKERARYINVIQERNNVGQQQPRGGGSGRVWEDSSREGGDRGSLPSSTERTTMGVIDSDNDYSSGSMNFRDGRTRMASAFYKDNAFKLGVSSSMEDDDDDDDVDDDVDDEEDDELNMRINSYYDDILEKAGGIGRERDSFLHLDTVDEDIDGDNDDDDDDDADNVGSLVNNAVQQRIEDTVNGESNILSRQVSSSSSSSTSLLSIDPKSVDIIPLRKVKANEEDMTTDDDDNVGSSAAKLFKGRDDASASSASSSEGGGAGGGGGGAPFVKMFRGSASYIANHRGTTVVCHIPGELLEWEGFPGLMDDIALTWLLGMKIVLVGGCRHQIDMRLDNDHEDENGDEQVTAKRGGDYTNNGDEEEREGKKPFGGAVMMSSIRVTDEDTLRVVKEEAGFVRFEIERRLAKSLRLHGGLVKGSESLVGNVVSGNFYSAQPFGVVDGVDYCWTGFPRKIEIERIRQVHETNDIVLLTSLGVSPSGEIFNVNSEFLAATVAGALSASKIIYFNVHGTSFQNKLTEKPVQNLRVSDAKNLLAHYKMRIHPKGFALVDLDHDSPQQSALHTPGSMETLIKVGYSMVALEKGVKRAHILAPENGALVQELYTRDGCGTLISRDIYEGIRRADVNDVSGIYELIDPLVRSGTLVERPKSTLEKEILSYYVYTRDELIVATGQLKRFEGGFAEIGCLVVSKDYRRGGRGDAMLGYLERLSLQSGASKVFVLSTQTMEWFVERGFKEVPVESLPPSRQAMYNKKRKSKIYMKEIDGDRDLDAAELWWSNK